MEWLKLIKMIVDKMITDILKEMLKHLLQCIKCYIHKFCHEI